ncbi:MAG: hypothetical protein AAFZ52_14780 [Bacteroidota bacterium]
MKEFFFTLSFLFLLVLAGTQVLDAQVTAQRMTHSRGNNDALILELPTAKDKMVNGLWSDWLKDNYKVRTKKVKKGDGEMQSLNFSIPGVSVGSKVDMYSKIRSSGSGSEIMVWIATPDGYVSPEMDPSRYVEAEKMMMRFALAVSRAQIEEEIEMEEKALKDLEKELEKLVKEKEKHEKTILDAEQAIEQARADIKANLGDQENKSREIEAQIERVEATKRKLKDF